MNKEDISSTFLKSIDDFYMQVIENILFHHTIDVKD